MARKLEERLAAVHANAADPTAPGAAAALREALRARIGLLVAAAAPAVAEAELAELVDELPAAFGRLLERPLERDPGCRGKVAVARALHRLDRWDEGVFPRGVRHIQREPVFGGSEDTAAELRAICGLAYAHAGRPDALDVLAELLADRERVARTGAAQALGDSGRPDAAALLRYKVLVGDEEPAVLAACFASLFALTGEGSLPFAARFLAGDTPEEVAEVAALAMAESRLPGAFPLLRDWCGETLASTRAQVGYLALALLRLDVATCHLLGVVRTGDPPEAIAAARALATFRADPALTARTIEAATGHADPEVAAAARAAFKTG